LPNGKVDIFVVQGAMSKSIRQRYRMDYEKLNYKPTQQMVASEFTDLMQNGNTSYPSVNDRLQYYSSLGKETPYLIFNLGEGAGSEIDPDPTIDFARTDCMTFCEHTLALAVSEKYPDMYNNLQKIRYKKGEISYTSRNHYTVADWLPNNSWLLKDVTREVGQGVEQPMTKTFDRPNFYRTAGVNEDDIKLASPKETKTVYYIPEGKIMDVSSRLKGGEIVSIVTTHPSVVSAHMGIIVRDPWDNLIFRHASSSKQTREVMDERLEDYVAKLEKSKSRVGMLFMRAREDFKLPN